MPEPIATPLKITLYDENSEPVHTYTRSFVPWKLLKAATKLAKGLDPRDLSEGDVDALAALVVEAFGGQFTVDQLNDGADIGEMLTVLNLIVSKARTGMGGNPTPPGM